MTSQHTADYPTLQEVLRLPVFAGCTVCGGAAGLGRRVSGVNLTDTPDYARWLAQGELLITTGFAIADDPQAVDALLPTAAEKGLSGVGIKPGVLCLLRTIFLETTYASCSGSTPASISNFVFLRIFGAFKASPSLSPTLPMKR